MGEASFGKYRLIAELGNGGMADVFLAVLAGPAGSGFRKLSVIKRLRQNLVDDPEFVAMLIEEARIAARLNHPNVVQTNEVGQVGEQYFIAMEYLDGQPLHRLQHRSAQRAKTTGAPSIARELQMVILMDALAGLHHAHDLADYDGSPLGIVHRDVTPQNIFVTYDGQVKVVDFGIAKAAGRASETRAGVVKGKIRYMAPEQATMTNVDRRADVFSVGIMLWELAAGRRMWPNMDDVEIAHHLIGETFPTSPRDVNPQVDVELDRICRTALAPNRDDRYATAENFRLDLEQYLADTGHLVAARRKLAPALSELFADKRATIKTVIEQQLAALDVLTSGEFKAITMPPESTLSSSSGVSIIQGPVSSPPSSRASGVLQSFSHTLVSGDVVSNAAALEAQPPAEAPRRERFRRAAAAVVILAAIGCVAVVAVRRTATRPAPAVAAQLRPAVEEISIRLNTSPKTARVVIDNDSPHAAGEEVRVHKDDREHQVRIEADGYVPRTETVRFSTNVTLSVDLQPIAVKNARSERPRTSAPAAAPAPAGRTSPAAQQAAIAATAKAPEPVAAPAPAPAPPPPEPAKPRRPKTEIDDGDPWANR